MSSGDLHDHMSTHLGPESPPAAAVLTESLVHRLPIERLARADLFNFGPVYNARLAFEMGKMAEIDFDHRVVYVGPARGSALVHLSEELSLVTSPLHLLPAAALRNPQEKEEAEELKCKVDESAEEFFQRWKADSGPRFDRIVVRDAHGLLEEPERFYADAVRALEPGRGRLLLIHRPVPITSLPMRAQASKGVIEASAGVKAVLEHFKMERQDVEWEVLRIPMLMTKKKWLSMIHHRYPAELLALSEVQIGAVLRELVDGPFKYCGDLFECDDALLLACTVPPRHPDVVQQRRGFPFGGGFEMADKELLRGLEASRADPLFFKSDGLPFTPRSHVAVGRSFRR